MDDTDRFDKMWNLPAESTVKKARTSDVQRVALPRSGGTAFLKRYWYPTPRDRLKGFFRNTFFGMSRAAREFRHLTKLVDARCSLVSALAYGEERSFRLLLRAFIVTEDVPGAITLEQLCRSGELEKWGFARRRLFFAALGNWIATFHGNGFRDNDLFPRNIIVHDRDDCFSFSKIDSPAGSGGGRPPGAATVYPRDVRDLDAGTGRPVNEPDRLRFLLSYLGASGVNAVVRHFLTRSLGERDTSRRER